MVRWRRWGSVVVGMVPWGVVLFAVYAMIRGLVLLLRGDESWRPVLWAVVVPLLGVAVGMGIQTLLVKALGPDDETNNDSSSFL